MPYPHEIAYSSALRGLSSDPLAAARELYAAYSLGNPSAEELLTGEQALPQHPKNPLLGDSPRSFDEALCFLFGVGVERDVEKCISYCRAVCGSTDRETKSDAVVESAGREDQAAAAADVADSAFLVGKYCLRELGNSGPRDDAQALKYFEQAANQGHAMAQCALGGLYESGLGVVRDYAEALRWYQKAALQGHAAAQYRQGRLYENGLGIGRKLPNNAAHDYEQAANQGHAMAQCALGGLYESGCGVPQSYAQAWSWYQKAADS